MKNDTDIRQDVESELRWAPELDETDIAVKGTGGVITLTGFVKTYMEKYEAERAAKRVKGVEAVANDIEVRLSSDFAVPDPELARNAVQALRTELPFVHEKIKVLVDHGRVTLEGSLDWGYQRAWAEKAVRKLKGMKTLINLLVVTPRVQPSDVKKKIQSAFVRSAQLDANRISVEAQDGEVILRGKVRTWAEREAAQETAWAAPGVTQVKNEISVSFV
jgi:osmotically-inducible protein OsmY